MKKYLLLISSGALALCPVLKAETLNSAEVTVTVNKVAIAKPDSAAVPASVGQKFSGRSKLETGEKSRAELTFNDQSVARLGANSVFSFSEGTRELELNQGVILMQVPKNAGGATIQTAAVTAAITGTTIAIEFFPKTDTSPGYIKILVLEGTLRLSLKNRLGESILLEAGQLVQLSPDDTELPDPLTFDLAKLVKTSGLLGPEFPPLASLSIIFGNIELQDAEKSDGKLIISDFSLNGEFPTGQEFFEQANQRQSLINIVEGQPGPRPVVTPVPTPVPLPPPTMRRPTPAPTGTFQGL